MKTPLILFSLLLAICSLVSASKAENFSNKDHVYFDVKGFYENPISKDLRITFNDYLNNKNLETPREMWAVKPRHLKFLKEKFIVLDIYDNPFGGYYFTIIINPKKMRVWKLWVYKTGEHEYQIRQLEDKAIKSKDMLEWKGLLEGEFFQYWQ